MSCSVIDHSIAGTFPPILCRHCHPEYNLVSLTAKSSSTAPPLVSPAEDFRARYPLSDHDRIVIAQLEIEEKTAAKAKAMDRIAALKAKIKERQEKKAAVIEPQSPAIKSKLPKSKDGELTDMVVHKRPGIIAAIMQMMQRVEGATQAEIHAELVKRFPDREAAGMLQTTKIQSRKLCSNVAEVVGRGLVFYMVIE